MAIVISKRHIIDTWCFYKFFEKLPPSDNPRVFCISKDLRNSSSFIDVLRLVSIFILFVNTLLLSQLVFKLERNSPFVSFFEELSLDSTYFFVLYFFKQVLVSIFYGLVGRT